ncbi:MULTISPECIES: glycosyltransferase [unclassified Fibrobacter]|uniref:glycosyltransferase n=1 Tax=unclassified Fibrobacter TaxID=2634177 RepID=UPI00091E8F9A|nr:MULTISPECIES: glycosyltransferase [unclassified Fibrobacter]SHK76052.1 Glycosyltransferase involved in cell wall bisynthesis [Fibrobacter sp. UWB12]SIO38539.1 Glycosyltransferase involved in cell wall bisynthesis [Fibrobacter sp. UWB11]
MNVLFVFNNPLDAMAGGVERVTVSVMRGLLKYGIQSFYLQDTGTETLFEGKTVDVERFFLDKSIDVVVQQLACDCVVSRYLSNKAKNIPYIVAWHTAPPTFVKSWRVASTKTFGSVSDEIKRFVRMAFFPIFYWKELKRFHARWGKIIPRVSKILLLSNSFAPFFQKNLHVSSDKITAIPNILSFDVRNDKSIIAQKKNEVLIVSRMKEPQKRISLALKIWREVEKSKIAETWTLKIIGDGENLQDYKKLAARMNLKNVQFMGKQNPRPFYETAAMSMMTSSFEGWGLTLTESQQFGVVPLAFDSYASIKDIIFDGENGFLIPYGNLKMYAQKMLDLMKDDNMRANVALNCLELSSRFDIENVLPMWREMLCSI